MSLEALQKEIEKKGGEQAKKLEEEARKEAELILADANKQVEEMGEREKQNLKDEIKRLENEYLANSELAKNTLLLGAREQLVNEIYARVRRELVKDLRDKQKQIFDKARKMAKGMEGMEHVHFVINRKDAALLKGVVGRIDYENLSGGLIVESEDGSIRINASIDSLLDNSADAIKSAITSTLFGDAKRARKYAAVKTAKKKSGSSKIDKKKKQKPKPAKKAKKAQRGKNRKK